MKTKIWIFDVRSGQDSSLRVERTEDSLSLQPGQVLVVITQLVADDYGFAAPQSCIPVRVAEYPVGNRA